MESIQENIEKELEEIKIYLEKSENPLIFFDDDHDGLISYILFKKKYSKCHGIVVKAGMKNEEIYFRKIKEYNPDVIFVLDRAEISQELIDSVNVPLIWIDHHPIVKREGARHFNPRFYNKDDNRPTSYWCYKIINDFAWIAMIGIIGDYHIPEFIDKFEYKELFNNQKKIEEILFKSEFGKLVKIYNFVLKGNTTQVRKNISMLCKLESPYELLNQETPNGKFLYQYYEKINKEYTKLLNKAVKNVTEDKIFLFTYPDTKLSISSGLSTELLYRFPNRLIIVAREKDDFMRISLRSKDIILPPLLEKALEGLDGYGGGHDHAVGANVNKKDFIKFINKIKANV